MSIDKIKNFNRRMARPKFAKGGYVKRKKFDVGGIAANSNAPGVGGPGNLTNTNTNGIGGVAQALGLNAASANIQPGTNTGQLNNAYTGANNAINAQVGLTNTLTPQAANAVNAQNQVENQALKIANGAGPNPAQNELAQATGTNVANEAALLAGQRGASANVGLAGRNAALAGTTAQQGAAGQAATLEAQQQIAAQQTAANIANQQVTQAQGATTNLNTAQQNEQNILQNANTAANNSAVGMQSNINNVNAQNNQGLLGGLSSGLGAVAGFLSEGGEVHPIHKHKLDFVHKMTKTALDHFADGGSIIDKIRNVLPSDAPASAQAAQPAPSPSAVDPDKAKSVSDSFKNATGFADGGPIQANPLVVNQPMAAQQMPVSNYAAPGSDTNPLNIVGPSPSNVDLAKSASQGYASTHKPDANAGLKQAQTDFNNNLSGGFAQDLNADNSSFEGQMAANGGKIQDVHPSQHEKFMAEHFKNYFSGGGKVPAMVSPGEVYLDPSQVEQVKNGADPLKIGERIPGKAKVKGDSLKNDVVKRDLDDGGVVVDRENVGNPDKARRFVLKSIGPKRHMKKPSRGA